LEPRDFKETKRIVERERSENLFLPREAGFPYSNETIGVLGKYDNGSKPLMVKKADLSQKS